MSEDTNTQAVVDETKAPAAPAAAVTDARDDDLDAALKSFDEATPKKSATPPAPADAAKDAPDLVRRISDLEKALTEREFETDIAPVIKTVRGEIPPEVYDDDDVRSWIDREAVRNPKLQQAWLDRRRNPAGFDAVVKGLQRKLAQRFDKLPDKAATEDTAAVTAALRGTSTKTPPEKAPNYGAMNNNEFSNELRKLGLSF